MRRTSMLAAMTLATVAGIEMAAAAMPIPRKGSGRDHKARAPAAQQDAAVLKEIAEWNAAADARKQAKALAKQRRAARGA